jgi:hypothetical protein
MECGNDRLGGVHDANEQIQNFFRKILTSVTFNQKFKFCFFEKLL